MTAIWSGHITFGLVSLPIQLHPVVQESRPRLHEVHVACGSRVRHRRVCEAEDRELQPEEIGRGWPTPDGRMVVLRTEDLDDLPLPTRKTIEVLGFVPDTDIDPIMYARPYYASPNGEAAQKPYALLVEALAGAGRVAICKIAIRTKERLAALRPKQGILVCHTLLWPQEIRPPDDWASSAPITEQELRLADVLMEQLTGVDVTDMHDEYGTALEQLILARAEHRQLPPVPEPPIATDLQAALEESIRRARGR